AASQDLAVGREGNRVDVAALGFESAFQGARLGVPDSDLGTTAGDRFAVSRKGNGHHTVTELVMPLQRSPLRVPQVHFTGPLAFDSAVFDSAAAAEPLATGTHNALAVGRDGNRVDVGRNW